VYWTWLTLSTDFVQEKPARAGLKGVTVSCGAGVGGVTSGGVVWLTVLLLPERLPAASTA
jgi:hypothetical protein